MSTRYGGLVAVGALALCVVADASLSSYRLGILTIVAAYTVASLAQNLLTGYAAVPSLGNVAFFAVAAYVSGELLLLAHSPAALALAAGIASAGALGLVIGLPTLRISGMHLAIVTVALVFVGKELMDNWDTAHGQNGVTVISPGWLLDERSLFLAAIAVAACAYFLAWTLVHSASGRAIIAQAENPHAATAAGIDATKYRLAVFVLCGLITGAAGVIYLYHLQTVTSGAFPLDLSLAFLTMMILGGTRSIAGSLLGGVIVGLMPEALQLLPNKIGAIDVQGSVYAVYAILLLVTLWLFPDGIWRGVTILSARRRA